ncbi:MAG: MFS transporter, partial [Caulobacteraceae bacterium]
MSDLGVLGGIPDEAAQPPITRRQVTAAVIGNGLEFYDFTTYAFFAVQIGHNFFPGRTPFISLMLSLGTFGAGFFLRPIGAILIGRYADKHGRRPAMLFSFALMGAAILGLALTPSYAAIGPLAPVLVVIWRLCQGFALGGEVGPTTAFLVEAAPPEKRGFYGAWQSVSQNLASVVGGLVGVSLAGVAGAAALETWGWRVAFLLGALVLPFGLILRRNLPETLHRGEAHAPNLPSGA